MPNSKLRCSVCRGYFPRGQFLKASSPAICTEECLSARQHGARNEITERRRQNKEKSSTPALDTRIRRRIRRRDGDRCRWCGITKGLEVHHIEYRSQGGSNEDHNLITLCREHHAEAHSSKRRWQPILRGYIWCIYVAGEKPMIPQLTRRVDRELAAA